MANNFNEFMDEFNVHTSASNSNPHKVSSKQIWEDLLNSMRSEFVKLCPKPIG